MPAIIIQAEAFGVGFDVVAPDPAASREFSDLASARSYAVATANARGWSVLDRSGEQ